MQTAFIDNPKARFLELYKQFVDFLEPNECGTPQEILAAYYRRLLSADENERIPAVYMWHDYERALSTATPAVAEHACPSVPEHAYPSVAELVEAPKGAPRNLPTRLPARQPHPQPRRPLPSTPTMEAHYFSNNSFLPPNMLLDNAERLNGIKGVLVQGECDYLCPPDAAQQLSARWRDSEVVIVKGAGHNQTEPGIQDALRAAINKLS